MATKRQVVSTAEAAEILGVSIATVRRMHERGDLRGFLSKSLGRITVASIEELLGEMIRWPAKAVLELIARERLRQIGEEGRTAEHDDSHRYADLVVHAATLLVDGTDAWVRDPLGRGSPGFNEGDGEDSWGLVAKHGSHGTKPDRLRALVIAGALVVAEIERVQREETPND